MRIIKFQAENIKKLRAVEITPGSHLVEITGPNGEGKSSVLDAIYYAIRGQGVIPSKVVREGEEKAFVKLDLGDDKVELIVTRKFSPDGKTTLLVEAPSGARFPSPQSVLDTLVGALSFDPLEFIRLKSHEQFGKLQELTKVQVQVKGELLWLAQVDDRIGEKAANRRDVNRQVKQLEARVAGLQASLPSELPAEPISIDILSERLDAVGQANTALEKRKAALKNEKAAIDHQFENAKKFRSNADEQRMMADRALKAAEEFDRRADEIESQAISQSEALDVSVEQEQPQDTVAIRAAIRQAEETNKLFERAQQRQALQAELATEQAKATALTAEIERLEALKREAIEKAPMPVENLSLGENQVLYRGLPLENASSAEQLRVSVALAMAVNPKLRVLRVKDGSLLDETSLATLASLCEASDYQLWLERVEQTDSRSTIVMEDGTVKK